MLLSNYGYSYFIFMVFLTLLSLYQKNWLVVYCSASHWECFCRTVTSPLAAEGCSCRTGTSPLAAEGCSCRTGTSPLAAEGCSCRTRTSPLAAEGCSCRTRTSPLAAAGCSPFLSLMKALHRDITRDLGIHDLNWDPLLLVASCDKPEEPSTEDLFKPGS